MPIIFLTFLLLCRNSKGGSVFLFFKKRGPGPFSSSPAWPSPSGLASPSAQPIVKGYGPIVLLFTAWTPPFPPFLSHRQRHGSLWSPGASGRRPLLLSAHRGSPRTLGSIPPSLHLAAAAM